MGRLDIAIIGGGAAGVFAAITAAEEAKRQKKDVHICVLESSMKFLTKVAISGGGRCNVTHHQFEPDTFCKSYPRGQKELISPMHQFQAKDTVDWFERRSVRIKTEEDGRMFPVSDHSASIVNCLLDEARKFNIDLFSRHPVQKLECKNGKFILKILEKQMEADRVLISTGSSPVGYSLSRQMGHTIEDLAPSLFSFNIRHALLEGLEGISFPQVWVELVFEDRTRFTENAPILITHWGLSGPGILKLSAWAAREMKKSSYRARLIVNWLGIKDLQSCENMLLQLKNMNSKSHISNIRPQGVTQRFWERLLTISKIPADLQWAHVTKPMIGTLVDHLFRCEFHVDGKSRNKEEFVECGGVARKEINWKTMESKIQKGLYFAGEVMDVDGVTGGFNLQHAWTTGYIAGTNMIK